MIVLLPVTELAHERARISGSQVSMAGKHSPLLTNQMQLKNLEPEEWPYLGIISQPVFVNINIHIFKAALSS